MMRKWKFVWCFAANVVLLLFITKPWRWTSSTETMVSTEQWNSEDIVLLYNRIPKTGSTSFMGVVYELCKRNHFSVVHLNVSRNSHYMSLWDQMHFAQNISNWTARKPTVYHGHVVYINFDRLGVKRPIYINIVRDPLERLVSYYYFLRYGDNFRPHLSRKRKGNNETFDECIRSRGRDCDLSNLWLQVPFFCGHNSECRVPGNAWALERAKETLVNDYLLVGLTDELEDFLYTLELLLPRVFHGAADLMRSGYNLKLRKTNNKISPSPRTVQTVRQSAIWKMEQEFYEFARRQFHNVKATYRDRLTVDAVDNGHSRAVGYHYEKIKPR